MTSRIVAVDPGYRNLAFVIFDFHQPSGLVRLIAARHADVGFCRTQEDVITRVWSVIDREKPFVFADHVIIENQLMGKFTKPRNQGLAWMLSTMALVQSPACSIEFMGSRRKFAEFKTVVQLPHQLPGKRKPEARGRRGKVKTNAIFLAMQLLHTYGIPPGVVFRDGREPEWEHLADAIGLAFVKIKHL